ncbi:MAG: hypothetical protein P4K78_10755 [Terracidiphilus sp.]|nr:hypothetical protein [Terracidiphilus sp.]
MSKSKQAAVPNWPWWYRSNNVLPNNQTDGEMNQPPMYSPLGLAILNGGQVALSGSYQSGLNAMGNDSAAEVGD